MQRTLYLLWFMFFSYSAYALPPGFVYLDTVAPDIIQEMRYATSNNFTGRPVAGYQSPRCVITRQAAKQLKAAQLEARTQGYGLKVYDCYRPQRAVDAFYHWSQDLNDTATKQLYYPHEPKNKLFKKGYIALRSGHSRGSTVDITLVKSTADKSHSPSIEMGTSFDFFDKSAHVFYSHLTPTQLKNRMRLRQLMISHGFVPYAKEWWHFTLKDEPHPKTYFNFPVR